MKISPERIVRKLHRQLVAETATCQQSVLMMEALQAKFGNNAIEPNPMMQDFDRVLGDSVERFDRALKSLHARIEENYDAIRELEAALAKKTEEDLIDIVNYVRERHLPKETKRR